MAKLIESGYEIVKPPSDNSEREQIVNDGIKQTRSDNYQQYCQQVPSSDTPSDKELEELNNKRALTIEERLKERKGNLIKRYGLEVTPELVEKDDRGWFAQLQLHYYLTVGKIYLSQRDQRSLSRIKQQGKNKAFKPDINKRQLSAKVKTLQLIEIEQFLDPLAEFTAESLQDWLNFVIQLRFDIQTILGVSIHPEKDSAIAVAQRILKKMGTKLKFKHHTRIGKKRIRVYQGCNIDADGRFDVFEQWLERDQKSLESFSAAA